MLDLESKLTDGSDDRWGVDFKKASNSKVGDCDDSLTGRNQV